MSDDTALAAEDQSAEARLNRKLGELRKTALSKQELETNVAQRKQAIDEEVAQELESLTEKERIQLEEAVSLFRANQEELTGGKVKYSRVDNGKVTLGADRESFHFDAKLAEKWLRRIRKWIPYSKPAKRVVDKDKIQKDRPLVFSAPRDVMAFVMHQAVTVELEGVESPLKYQLPDRDVLPPSND